MVMYQNVPLGPSGEDLTERVIEGCDYTMGSDLDRHRAARGPVSLPSHTPSDPASVRVAASPSDMASSGVQARREESKREAGPWLLPQTQSRNGLYPLSPFNLRLSCLSRKAFGLMRDSATDNPDPSTCALGSAAGNRSQGHRHPRPAPPAPREPSTAAPRLHLLVPWASGLD